MRLYECYEVVLNSIEDDIKYNSEINKEFDSNFLDDVLDFLSTRVDVLNRAEIRERSWNKRRNLEK
jgi:hypothetical protein|nr:MAG TPA: hypothetical protein [Caudoviricetes sp.]